MATDADEITIRGDLDDIVASLIHGNYTTSIRMTTADLFNLRLAIDTYIETAGLRP